MQTDRILEVAQLAVKLGRLKDCAYGNNSGYVARRAYKIAGLASRLRRLYEQECNVGSSHELDARQSKLQFDIQSELNEYGLKADFNGDPRGYAVYIHFPDKSYNTMGGEETGYGI